jgi:HD-GYP domain-containing protein (c-di-GMP phosphodiesterase class II)
MPMLADSNNPLALLLELGQAFHSTLELDPLLVSVLKTMQSAVRSEGGSIWLLSEDRQRLTCTQCIGPEERDLLGESLPADDLRQFFQANQGRAARLARHEPVSEAAQYLSEWVRADTRSLAAAPLVARGELLGLVTMTNKLEAPGFSAAEAELLHALASHAAIAIQNAQLYEQQKRNVERQQLLDQIGVYFQETLNLDDLIGRIFTEVNKAIQAEGQSIWLLDADGKRVTCRLATGLGAHNVINLTVPVDKSIVGSTILSQQPLLITDAQQDPRLNRRVDAKTGLITRTLMSVPMVREGKAIGALQAINKRGGALFTSDDLSLFLSIASSAALAVENARLFEELQASYDMTLDALTAALDLRDRETEGHSRRVVAYTMRLAQQLGLREEDLTEIRRGALLHDVGKIGVPDRILHKPGPLDPDERREIQKHPQNGYEMLLGIPHLAQPIWVVLAHHEKWDGSGYPLGLRGEAIPLGARLFAIADVYDALTSDRPYRKQMSYEAARDIIAKDSGTHFDPTAVQAFLAVPPAEWEQIRAEVSAEVAQRRQHHEAQVRRGHTAMLNPAAVPPPPA